MPVYLWQASYTAEGCKGLLKEGGSKRQQYVTQLVEKAGGKMLAFYFAFGSNDVTGIVEFPDHPTALSMSLAVNAAGAVRLQSTLLLKPEEVDAATKKTVAYRAPGA